MRSAHATALEGLALPHGDTTVGSWRNTPHTVSQNVGAYLDIPRMLDSDHRRAIGNSAPFIVFLDLVSDPLPSGLPSPASP